MKYTTILGLLLLVAGLIFAIVSDVRFGENEFIAGVLVGSGVGLLLGGLIGYSMKKTKIIKKEIVTTNVTPKKPIIKNTDSEIK